MTYKVYFSNAGVPATGLTLTWEYLKKVSDGSDYGSPPSFTQVGGGWYKFDYSANDELVGVIDGSVTLGDADRYVAIDLGPLDNVFKNASTITTDFDTLMARIYQLLQNKMIVNDTTGDVALRDIGDSTDIATGNVVDNSVTTVRTGLTWS